MVPGEVMKYIVIVLVFLNDISKGNFQESCNCIRLKECSTFVILIKTLEGPMKSSFIDYLRTKHCDQQQGQPKVCCPDQMKENGEVYSATISSISSTTRIPIRTQPCMDMSNCIMLKNCTTYMNFIKFVGSPLTRSVVHFLRSQECGFQDGMPKVCCTALPANLYASKHARPGSRRPFKKLSAAEEETTSTTRRSIRASPRPSMNRFKQEFSSFRDEIMSSDFFDYTGSFDLVLRKKRFDNDSFLDIEIR